MIGEAVIVAADRRTGCRHRPSSGRRRRRSFPSASSARPACGRAWPWRSARSPSRTIAAVGDDPADRGGGEGLVHARPADRRRSATPVFEAPSPQARRRTSVRAGQLLQPRDAADMVEMLMAVQQIFDVARAGSRAARILSATRSAPASVPRVDQDMALVAGDQDGGNAAGADQIGVGVDADRRRRLVPVVKSLQAAAHCGPASSIGALGRSICRGVLPSGMVIAGDWRREDATARG